MSPRLTRRATSYEVSGRCVATSEATLKEWAVLLTLFAPGGREDYFSDYGWVYSETTLA